jgi:hypothetical protein
MADKLYLLVCEGYTDILVINKIAKKISEDIDDKVVIRELSPQKDATTNRYPSHGWEEVRRWCKVYGKTIDVNDNPFAILAKKKNWRALIKTSKAHGLIIQMDTDIVQYITDLIPNYSGTTKNSRKNFAKKAILNWLGETTVPNEIYLLLSTQSTETWLLATHNRVESIFTDLPINFDYEDIVDVIERLLTLGYLSYIDEGKKKLSKNNYKPYAQQIVDKLDKVCLECEEAEKLCREFKK